MKTIELSAFSKKALRTRVKADKVTGAERWLGFCLGPAIVASLYAGVFNLFLSLTGYIPPASDGSWVAQPQAVQNFFVTGMFGVPCACMVLFVVLFSFFDLEKKLPQIHEDIAARSAAQES